MVCLAPEFRCGGESQTIQWRFLSLTDNSARNEPRFAPKYRYRKFMGLRGKYSLSPGNQRANPKVAGKVFSGFSTGKQCQSV